MSFTALLDQISQNATSTRDLGDKFERLFVSYLKNEFIYKDLFRDVWLWMEWPGRGNQADTGIDIVAQERYTDNVWAIQCKFYDSSHTLQKSDIDSFFTASGKEPFTDRMIVSTTDNWSKNAEEALKNQKIPVTRIRLKDLVESSIDWSKYSFAKPDQITLNPKKQIRPHQVTALDNVVSGFKTLDKGKMIMACGTGKTFTSLKIAEKIAVTDSGYGYVLFLVPSISLLSQTLREWTQEADIPLHSIAVCSDKKVGKKETSEDISLHDLAYPATTDAQNLITQVKSLSGRKHLSVIFSTYQSIEVVAEAQKGGLPEFDLIICDEAHRTTGVTLDGDKESHFIKVHKQSFIQGKKRLYMTATPRIYDDSTKVDAKENKAELCSMDDPQIYGEEFHRLGFSEAVSKGLLSDYKVMVLAVDEKYVSKTFQSQIADKNNEISLDDAVKITGCWNGLSKRMSKDNDPDSIDNQSMRRAVAFSRTIKDSKRITELFSEIIAKYQQNNISGENFLNCHVQHVDGSFNALKRNEKLDWLKGEPPENSCNILSNARCLSEGVDVPALDAVLFLNPRNSVVDVVQSVGRVMRKAEGKKYGYIILPIGIPADMTPEQALKDNQKYKVVWQVLQALRAHDDRFNTTINQIDLNKNRPENINVIGVGEGKSGEPTQTGVQNVLSFPNIEQWRDAIYAKIVVKCGDRRYWEDWANDVANIAQRHTTRIKALLEAPQPHYRETFDKFLEGLRAILNPSIGQDEAIEMLSQHMVTKPVFDALFEGYEFTKHNPVSITMQSILDLLEGENLHEENNSLEAFYESVRNRAKGVDNAAGKQAIIKELYEKFFQKAFPKISERLGIVYTPIEVVDFILNSVDEALQDEFDVCLGDHEVNILEPFAGTGTFITRLLQSGLINPQELPYKYQNEIHANEILLLAYYISAINIEQTYHEIAGGNYENFPGMVLTDTFQMTESVGTLPTDIIFPATHKSIAKQNRKAIDVIIGNPPYSAGQTSENDGNKNLKYPQLDESIRSTYAKYSSATLKNSLYDSYIRAIRWASNRIKDKGIVCYVSNGSFIDGNATDGLRKCLGDEFTSIYCFNLRGNARSSGEERRKEKGNVFGEGTRTPVAITLLVKNPAKAGNCDIYYSDIGDYLNREDKLNKIENAISFKGKKAHPKNKIELKQLIPNNNHDWINQRDPSFENFISMGDKKDKNSKVVFEIYSSGVKTNRDNWVYNFSKDNLSNNMIRMIDFYNQQVEEYKNISKDKVLEVNKFIDNDPKKISWTGELIDDLKKFRLHTFDHTQIVQGIYRPFCKQKYYFNKCLNNRLYQMPKIFPNMEVKNLVIGVTGIGSNKYFSALILDTLPDLEIVSKSQCFPLYSYEKDEQGSLNIGSTNGYKQKENITDEILKEFRTVYSSALTKEDIFYYIYGILHSPEYKKRFESDLKKMLPRIPLAEDFWAFSKAGRELAQWHLNYETIEPYPLTQQSDLGHIDPKEYYRVSRMSFGKKEGKEDKSIIIYNSSITLRDIPLEAYEYIVNGKSALEWIIERYQVTKDKDSHISNNPNDWSEDPQYILNLVKRIVRVSLETVRIVKGLPQIKERG